MMIKNYDRKVKNSANRTALYGIFIALSMILSFIETLIPVSIGIPGVKLGLANLVVLISLYVMTPLDAFCISIVRLVLISFTFGNLAALQFSAAGAILSYILMFLCIKFHFFGKTGVSIVGGISHNIGQLIVAAFVLENAAVFTYLPVLLLSGTVTGALIGLLGGQVIKRIGPVC